MSANPQGPFFVDYIQRTTEYLEKNHFFSLSLILATALVLRLYHLDYQSLSLEELQVIKSAREVQAFQIGSASIYSVILHFLLGLTSYSEFVGRLLSVCFGLLGIWIIFCLGTEVVNKTAGLFCAFLTAFNYYHILCSQELTAYSMLFFLVLVSYYFFFRLMRRISIDIVWLWYIVFTTILVCTHFIGLLVISIQLITILLVMSFERNRGLKYALIWLITFGVVILLFLPWAGFAINELVNVKFGTPASNASLFLDFYFRYFNNDLVVVYGFLGFLAFPFYRAFLDKDAQLEKIANRDLVTIGLWMVVSFVALYLYSMYLTLILSIKFTFALFSSAILIASVTYSTIHKAKIRGYVLLIILFSTFVQFFFVYDYYGKLRTIQIREAAKAVVDNYDGKSKVFSKNATLIDFYFTKFKSNIKVIDTNSKDFREEIQNEENFWLVDVYNSALYPQDQAFVDSLFVAETEYKFWYARAVNMKSRIMKSHDTVKQ